MIPTVRSVTSDSICATSMLYVSRSTSQNTGVAPMSSTTFAVETHVNAGTITSSPGETPSAATMRCSALVHDVAATACGAPTYAAEALLELLDERPLEHVAALERLLDRAKLLGPEERPRDRDLHEPAATRWSRRRHAITDRGPLRAGPRAEAEQRSAFSVLPTRWVTNDLLLRPVLGLQVGAGQLRAAARPAR